MSEREALENAIVGAGKIDLCGHWCFTPGCLANLHAVLDAARAHLDTLPKAKMVETYHVEFTVWACNDGWEPRIEVVGDKVLAEVRADLMRKLNGKSCVRITGPHKHEVPA